MQEEKRREGERLIPDRRLLRGFGEEWRW